MCFLQLVLLKRIMSNTENPLYLTTLSGRKDWVADLVHVNIPSLSFWGAGRQQKAQNDERTAARSFAGLRWGMLSAAAKQVREKSNEVQPLSAPLTACPVPCCSTSHLCQGGKTERPCCTVSQHKERCWSRSSYVVQAKASWWDVHSALLLSIKVKGDNKAWFLQGFFSLPHVFCWAVVKISAYEYEHWHWTSLKRKKKNHSLLINLLPLSSASSLLNYC